MLTIHITFVSHCLEKLEFVMIFQIYFVFLVEKYVLFWLQSRVLKQHVCEINYGFKVKSTQK